MKQAAFRISLGLVLAMFTASTVVQAAGDPEKGAKIFQRCKACHTLIEGQKKIGPNLRNVFGRKAGSLPAYRYSKAMSKAGESGIVWNEETLDKFLKKPSKFVRGTEMMFNGIRSAQQRQDVIEFLKQQTTR